MRAPILRLSAAAGLAILPITVVTAVFAGRTAPTLAAGAQPHPNAREPLVAMTFNLRFAGAEGPHAWPARRAALAALVRDHAPHVLCTQEGLFQQLRDLESDLVRYRWIGAGREGGSHGEFMAVFYDPERLEPLEYDHLWLSETPRRIGSSSWASACPRMLTWVRFRDHANGTQWLVANTHLDHVSEEARAHGAELLVNTLGQLYPESPLLLLGDFNAAAGESRPYSILVDEGPFADTWDLAAERGEACATFSGWRAPRPGPRIDWILARGALRVASSAIVTEHPDGVAPSDHFPVVTVVESP